MSLLWPILLIFAGALIAPTVSRRRPDAGWWLALIPAISLAGMLWVARGGADETGLILLKAMEWVPTLGTRLSFRLDGLSLVFGIMILLIGLLIVIYAGGYLHDHPKRHRFYGFILFFMGSMLGVVMADNVITLFIFWEMTSVSSYLLIGFNHEEEGSRKKALQALLVTGTGGLALLAGLVLLGEAAGTYEFSEMVAVAPAIAESPLYLAIALLFFAGAFTKSAQFPFHFWLPNAMAAPTPVSAYLHSATMVKAGVYLLARFTPVLGGTELWHITITVVGAITMLLAVFLGIMQTDLKKILAYTTLGVLGILTMLIGWGTELALKAAVLFLLGHALYKAALFMTSGAVDHSTGTREVRILGGLGKVMPFTAVAAILAALSMSGFPPLFGFLGKEYVYKSGLALSEWAWLLTGAALLTNVMMMAMAFNVSIHPFGGRSRGETPHHPHEGSLALWLPPMLLAAAGLLLGLLAGWTGRAIVVPAVASVVGQPVEFTLKLWHGFNLPLALSGVTVAAGLAVFLLREHFWRIGDRFQQWNLFGPERAYESLLAFVIQFSKVQTRFFQNGYLSNYILTVVGATAVLMFIPLWRWDSSPPDFTGMTVHGVLLALVMAASAVLASWTSSRLTALVALGMVGLGMALIFVLYSAPDLAITQVLVETLVVVLFMFVIYRLPKVRRFSSNARYLRDAIFSLGVGACLTWLIIKAQQVQLAEPISHWHAELAYVEAKGRNVVNVILVDFRALDTLGEVVVLAIAALGVAALVGSLRKSATSAQTDEKEEGS